MSARPKRTRAASKKAEEAVNVTANDVGTDEEDTTRGKRKAPAAKKGAGGATAKGRGKSKTAKEDHHKGGTVQGKVLERGLVYFFYRPKVEDTSASGPADVQRLYIVLSPGADARHDTESGTHKKRVIIIGHKSLPVIKESGRRAMTWGFVDVVTTDLKDVHKALDAATYNTETRGERHLAACRPCGEGVYAIFDFDRHTHLAYVLELPKELGTVQDTFHIEREGSYVLSVKNPQNFSTGQGLGPSERAKLPAELEKVFEGRKWFKASPIELLDYPGVELLLIGVSKNVEYDLGEEGAELKEEERLDAKQLSENKLFQELKMSKKEHPAQPLYGQWA